MRKDKEEKHMEAGLKMDKEVDRKIFGIKVRTVSIDGRVPPYSTDISAAWQVVEHFRKKQYTVLLNGQEWYDGGSWDCTIYDVANIEKGCAVARNDYDEIKNGWDDPSAPLAICRAALEAVSKT